MASYLICVILVNEVLYRLPLITIYSGIEGVGNGVSTGIVVSGVGVGDNTGCSVGVGSGVVCQSKSMSGCGAQDVSTIITKTRLIRRRSLFFIP